MKKILLLIGLILLVGCGSSPEYTVVEKEKPEGQKASIRIYTESTNKEDLKEIVDDIKTNELFGAPSIHVHIHNPPKDNEDFGGLFATGKYANTSQGTVQVGIEEIGEPYIEFE